MKKLILGLLCVIFLGGCFHGTKFDYSTIKEDVFLDPHYVWSNSPVQEMFKRNASSVRSITLRVVNRKYCSVEVKVSCFFQPEDVLFGTNSVVVGPREDKVFTVRGFARLTPDPETVQCRIMEVK